METLFAVAILLAASAAAASAAPTKLVDLQLDNVTAGTVHVPVDPPPVNGHPWHPGGPPVFHPILFCFGGRCTSGH